jgi:hypothetical protein
MSPRWASALAALSFAAAPQGAVTAQAEPLETGREVRLFVRGVAGSFEGVLTGVRADAVTLVLRDGSFFTLQTRQVERSEVLGMRRNTTRGALVGLGVGLGVGIALAVTSRDACDGFCADPGDHFDEWQLVWPALAGAAGGALVGRLIRTPRWVPGFLPGSTPDGGGVALRWSLPVGSRS